MTKIEMAQTETLYTVYYRRGKNIINSGLTLEEAADKMLCRGGGKWGVRRSRDKKLSGWQIWVSYRDTDGPWVWYWFPTDYTSHEEDKTIARMEMLEKVVKGGINGLEAVTDAEYEAGQWEAYDDQNRRCAS